MPVCFTEKQYKMIEEFAKRNGMLNASQALEKILKNKQQVLLFLFSCSFNVSYRHQFHNQLKDYQFS